MEHFQVPTNCRHIWRNTIARFLADKISYKLRNSLFWTAFAFVNTTFELIQEYGVTIYFILKEYGKNCILVSFTVKMLLLVFFNKSIIYL